MNSEASSTPEASSPPAPPATPFEWIGGEDRVHALVERSAPMPRPKMFFGVGSKEETDDRDNDGIIDVLDDARDLIEGWKTPDGKPHKGLRQFGYAANLDHARKPNRDNAALYLLEGGRHDQPSWARMLPVFLRWAYPATTRMPANRSQQR